MSTFNREGLEKYLVDFDITPLTVSTSELNDLCHVANTFFKESEYNPECHEWPMPVVRMGVNKKVEVRPYGRVIEILSFNQDGTITVASNVDDRQLGTVLHAIHAWAGKQAVFRKFGIKHQSEAIL